MNELILTGGYIKPLLDILYDKKYPLSYYGNSIYIRSYKGNVTIVHPYILDNPEKREGLIKDIPIDIINKIIGLLSIGVDKFTAFESLMEYLS